MTIDMPRPDWLIRGLRNERDQSAENLAEVFAKNYRGVKRTFEEWFAWEADGLRRGMLSNKPNSEAGDLVSYALSTLEQNGVGNLPEAGRTLARFVNSDAFVRVPWVLIQVSFWASIGMKASSGQKVAPDRGTWADNEVLTLVPYCDAMFIDRRCAGLLRDIPQKNKLPYPTLVFSMSNCSAFLDYLGELEQAVNPEHRALVELVYGPKWTEPDPPKP